MNHKYSLGQRVQSAGASFADRTGGVYEVIRLMPEGSNGEFGYWIRHTTSGTQRAVGESEIRAVAAEPAHPSVS